MVIDIQLISAKNELLRKFKKFDHVSINSCESIFD